jgi:hypothetical protein
MGTRYFARIGAARTETTVLHLFPVLRMGESLSTHSNKYAGGLGQVQFCPKRLTPTSCKADYSLRNLLHLFTADG